MSSLDSLRWDRDQAWTQSRETPPDTREDISPSKVRRQEVRGNGNKKIMDVHEEISRLLGVEKTLEEQLKVNAEQKQRLNELQQTIHERDAKVSELEEFLEQRDALIDFGKGLLQKKDKDTKDLAREVRNRVNFHVGNLMKEKMELQNSCVFLKKDQAFLRDQLDQVDEQHQQDQDRNEKLEAEVSKLKDELKQHKLTEQELTQTVLERNAIQRKVDELKEFLEQRDALIDFGKDLLKKTNKEFKDLAREFRNKVNAYVGNLMENYIHLKDHCVDLEDATVRLEQKLDEADQQHLEDVVRNTELESELAKSKKLQQHQQQKIQDLKRTSQDLEEQLDEAERYHIQDAVENLKNVGELGETQRKLKKSEAENEALKTRLQQTDKDAETKDQNKEEIHNEQDKKMKKRSWWKCWE